MNVLVSAYACEPDRGSESEAGWQWAIAAACRHEVWVLTRENNRSSIEATVSELGLDSLHPVFIDLPTWTRRWKRGGRGVRTYYILWQILVSRTARQLGRRIPFDVVHHVTFANVWLPALASSPGARFILGPVGGGVRVPRHMYRTLGLRGATHEMGLQVARRLIALNPWTRATWRRADLIIAQNHETRNALPRCHRAKCIVRPNAWVAREGEPSQQPRTAGRSPTVAFAGRFVPWKGGALAIATIARLPTYRLVMIGAGSDERRLRALVKRHGVADRVSFHPWLTRDALWRELCAADVLLLPSLREEASFLAAEAAARGVNVVAFSRGGPAVLAHDAPNRIHLVPLTTDPVTALTSATEHASRHQTGHTRSSVASLAAFIDNLYRCGSTG